MFSPDEIRQKFDRLERLISESGDGHAQRLREFRSIVVALREYTTSAEAREQHKSLRAHWAHLVVHGALHLVGYDHEDPADANRMERREVSVLRRLGFPNPYRSS